MTVPAIRLEHVGKSFALDGGKQFTALSDIDLSIGKGEFVALLGPSGCGKSTILRLVAALEGPSSGRVTIEGAERLVEQQNFGLQRQSAGNRGALPHAPRELARAGLFEARQTDQPD